MSNIISLAEARKKRNSEVVVEKKPHEIYKESLWSEWKYNSDQNNLIDFVSSKLSLSEEEKNWSSITSIISEYEAALPICFAIRSPGFTFDNLKGWQAVFVFNEIYYETPVLETEQQARVFMIFLFNNLMEELSNKKA